MGPLGSIHFPAKKLFGNSDPLFVRSMHASCMHVTAVAMLHVGMRVRITVTMEGATVDSTGEVAGLDLHPTDMSDAESRAPESVRLLRELPLSVLVKVDDSNTELLPPRPCTAHRDSNADSSSELSNQRRMDSYSYEWPSAAVAGLRMTSRVSGQRIDAGVLRPSHPSESSLNDPPG